MAVLAIAVLLLAAACSASASGSPSAEASQAGSPSAEPTPASTPEPTPTPTPEPTPNQDSWDVDAVEHRAAVGERFTYTCAPLGVPTGVWGTDIYTDDSSVCSAAVHAGVITVADGGVVTIEMRAGQTSYPASTRNGIESRQWGTWDGSFVFPAQ